VRILNGLEASGGWRVAGGEKKRWEGVHPQREMRTVKDVDENEGVAGAPL